MPLLPDVKAYIENNVPEASGYTIQLGFKSQNPDKQIVIYETGGLDPETTFDADYPSFQVQVRGERFGYAATHEVAFAVYRALQTTSLVDLDVSPASDYVYCYAQGGLLPLGQDSSERPEFSMNFRTMRTF